MLNFFKTLCVATGSFFVESGFSNATRSGFYEMLLIDGCAIVIPPVPGFQNDVGYWPGYFNTTRFGFKNLLADGAIKMLPFLGFNSMLLADGCGCSNCTCFYFDKMLLAVGCVYSNATRSGFYEMLLADGCGYSYATRSGFRKCCWWMAVVILMPPVPGFMKCYRLLAMAIVMPPVPGLMHGIGG